MKIQIFSDLHLEFGDYHPSISQEVDVVLFAGDVATELHSIEWLENLHQQCAQSPYFLYICGNHEFYGETFPNAVQKLKEQITNDKLILLENESVCINDVEFVGATLWSDFFLFGDQEKESAFAASRMNDYRKITYEDPQTGRHRLLSPLDIIKVHDISRRYLEKTLALSQAEKVVVMTHHAPSIRSVPASRIHDPIYAAYASDLVSMCRIKNGHGWPDLWVHGHIHQSQDYFINRTHVMSNPRGYEGFRPNPNFKDQCVVEL